mgnify:CR=1 FL=1
MRVSATMKQVNMTAQHKPEISPGRPLARTYATAPYTMKSLYALLTGRFTSEAHRDWQHYTHYYPDNTFVAERVKE